MSTDTAADAASTAPADSPSSPLEALDLDWAWFTVRACGPAKRSRPLREGPDGAALSAEITLTIERPLRSGEEFKQFVLRAFRPDSDGLDPIVMDLLEDYPSHEQLHDHPEQQWSVEVTAPVAAWERLAHQAMEGFDRSPPLRGSKPVGLLRSAASYDIAGPNCALALAKVAAEKDLDQHQASAIQAYCEQAGVDLAGLIQILNGS